MTYFFHVFSLAEMLTVSGNMLSELEWIDVPRNRESVVVEVHGIKSFRSLPIRISLGRVHAEENYLIIMAEDTTTTAYLARGSTGEYQSTQQNCIKTAK